jgi:hypothetical protein
LSTEQEAFPGEHLESSSLGSGERTRDKKANVLLVEEPGRTGGDGGPSLVLEKDRGGDDNLISAKGGGGYGEYTVVQLKNLLRARSLKVSGKKADVVARLRADDSDKRGA